MKVFRFSVIPFPVVILLCAASFLFGRWSLVEQQPSQPIQLQLGATGSRKLVAAVQPEAVISEVTSLVPSPHVSIDPLDPAQLENWVLSESGLVKLRPPLQPGASGDAAYRIIPFQILSWYPRVVVYPGFVDKARCDHIIQLAKNNMYPSGLAYRPGEAGPNEQQTRTSTGTFLGRGSDPDGVLAWVEERIAAATLLPASNGEAFNVLHYRNLQHYDSHYDTFDPKDFGPQPNQRIATVLVYLSEVLAGGETVFKREGLGNGERVIMDWRNCNDGSLKYYPRRGDAVLFWATLPDGRIDQHALHGGCPVTEGEKWVATKWIHAKGAEEY